METPIEQTNKSFNLVKEIIIVTTVLFYIIFSIIKRFGNDAQLFWIPFVLFVCNFLILAEVAYSSYQKKSILSRKNKSWLIIQFIVTTVFLGLIGSYLFY